MADEKDKEREKQKEKKKKRSLHKKSRERRKKDVMPNLPFIIAFQGDSAVNFMCEDVHADMNGKIHTYHLNPIHGGEHALRRLARYFHHKLTRFHMGQVLVYKAGTLEIEACQIIWKFWLLSVTDCETGNQNLYVAF